MEQVSQDTSPKYSEQAKNSSSTSQSIHCKFPDNSFPVEVIDVAFGGKGVAKVEGKTWFIEGAVPGDILLVSPINDSGRYGDALLTKVIVPSPLRSQKAMCPHHQECGGCQWQEIPYEEQLKWKQKFVANALTRIGKLEHDASFKVVPSESIYGYRNRILLRVHLTVNENCSHNLKFGYFAKGTRSLVPIKSCSIASDALNQFTKQLNTDLFLPIERTCLFRLEIQELPMIPGERQSSEVLLTLYPSEGSPSDFKKIVEILRGLNGVAWCGLVFDLKNAPYRVYDRQDSLTYWTKPGLFQQVNLSHNHTLRRLVKEWVLEKNPKSVLDLFCGSGNLSLGLSNEVSYIEGLELSKDSIHCAQHNLTQNTIKGPTYLAGDGEKHMWKCARKGENFDLVILDPPRQGFFKGVVPLKMLNPQWILYVSCDPSTLARDLSYICRNGDYKIEKLVALDFFPHTYHIETLVMLARTEVSH